MNVEQKTLRTEVADYKRRRICEEASHLIYALGYESTTLDAVAERLKITKPVIYSYYRNKGEILFEICQMGISLSLEALREALASGGTARERLRMVVDRVARIVLDNQQYIVIYEREEKNLESADARRIREQRLRFDRELSQLLAEGQEKGEFAIDDIPLTATTIGGSTMGMTNRWRRLCQRPCDAFTSSARPVPSSTCSSTEYSDSRACTQSDPTKRSSPPSSL